MENNFDTIVAIATPIAQGAIGIIRISGENALNIASNIFKGKIEPKKLSYGHIVDGKREIDEVILLYFKAPKSYTGEDVIEIQSHGSYVILNDIVNLIIKKGARPAQRGEFTKRAFLNKRIDLSQAEAVLDLINSKSQKSAGSALNNLEGYLKNQILTIKDNLLNLYSKLIASVDFPEDVAEVDKNYILSICNDNIQKINKILGNAKSHNFIRDGINICLIGKPNVGKSSLFNSLLSYNRAIVTDIAGTTRDTIKETLNINGYLVNFIDTAGIRDKEKADKVEQIGIENSIETIKKSQIVAFLYENSQDEISRDLINLACDKKIIYIKTKCDISGKDESGNIINISSLTGFGIDILKQRIEDIIKELIPYDTDYTTNLRQQSCLTNSLNYLNNVIETVNTIELADLCATDLKSAILALDEITGEVLTDEVLNNIFDNFCIGK